MLTQEAENCRLQALSYLGTREASFLLSVAREFDDLALRADSAQTAGYRVVEGASVLDWHSGN